MVGRWGKVDQKEGLKMRERKCEEWEERREPMRKLKESKCSEEVKKIEEE